MVEAPRSRMESRGPLESMGVAARPEALAPASGTRRRGLGASLRCPLDCFYGLASGVFLGAGPPGLGGPEILARSGLGLQALILAPAGQGQA